MFIFLADTLEETVEEEGPLLEGLHSRRLTSFYRGAIFHGLASPLHRCLDLEGFWVLLGRLGFFFLWRFDGGLRSEGVGWGPAFPHPRPKVLIVFDEAGALPGVLDELAPEAVSLKGVGTAEDEERGLGAGQGHVQASSIRKETDSTRVGSAHTGKDDNFLFLSLIAVLKSK